MAFPQNLRKNQFTFQVISIGDEAERYVDYEALNFDQYPLQRDDLFEAICGDRKA